MNVSEVIRTIHRKSGLAYERISMLAGFEATFLERALREGYDIRVDDFCAIVDVCGYTLCVRGRCGSMTLKRSIGECKRDDYVCASDAAYRIYKAAGDELAEVKNMPESDRQLLSRLVQYGAMPEVTSLARLCEMVGCEFYFRRFREVYLLDSGAPEKDIEVVVSQGRPLREMMRERGRNAKEYQRATNSLSARKTTVTKRVPKRNTTATKKPTPSRTKAVTKQSPSPSARAKRRPSGAECTIDEKFREFIRSFS